MLSKNRPHPPYHLALPMTPAEMQQRHWNALDVLLITGDAYVDHPSFGVALLGRWLEAHGYRVGIVAQPRWDCPDDITALGRPRLFAGITAGAIDSMLAHYTAFRKKRSDDAYTPGGRAGARPNRTTLVYTGLVRQAFPGLPVLLGGIEASLRRAVHYDFWTDKLRRSLLIDSKADLLIYGMGERALLEAAQRLESIPEEAVAQRKEALRGIAGTAFALGKKESWPPSNSAIATLPSFEEIQKDPQKLMEATLDLERHVHQGSHWLRQDNGDRCVLIAPPAAPLSTRELDRLYDLPYTRRAHPSYTQPIPAADMIQFSITSHRGCGGGCSFCSLALHQGRRIRSRSTASLQNEVRQLTRHPDWRGSISDVGGPTANMWGAYCDLDPKTCKRTSCLSPKRCPHFQPPQEKLLALLKQLQHTPGVKHLRVASGIRYDLALHAPRYLKGVLHSFVGGQIKVAPEHCVDHVLHYMRKPSFAQFEKFLTFFEKTQAATGKRQYIIPYLLSAFPGCTDDDMRTLAAWLKKQGWQPKQVQCFIPTPGTVATAMYYSGRDINGAPIPVARTDAERQRQHHILLPTSRHSKHPKKNDRWNATAKRKKDNVTKKSARHRK